MAELTLQLQDLANGSVRFRCRLWLATDINRPQNASVGFNWFGLGTCQLFQWFQSETNGGTCCARIILCSSKSLQVSIVHVPFCFCGLYSSDLLVKHWLLRRVWSEMEWCLQLFQNAEVCSRVKRSAGQMATYSHLGNGYASQVPCHKSDKLRSPQSCAVSP